MSAVRYSAVRCSAVEKSGRGRGGRLLGSAVLLLRLTPLMEVVGRVGFG